MYDSAHSHPLTRRSQDDEVRSSCQQAVTRLISNQCIVRATGINAAVVHPACGDGVSENSMPWSIVTVCMNHGIFPGVAAHGWGHTLVAEGGADALSGICDIGTRWQLIQLSPRQPVTVRKQMQVHWIASGFGTIDGGFSDRNIARKHPQSNFATPKKHSIRVRNEVRRIRCSGVQALHTVVQRIGGTI